LNLAWEFVGLGIRVRKELEIPSRGNPPRPTNSLNHREAAVNRRRSLVARLFHNLNRCCDHSLTIDRRVGTSPWDKRAKSQTALSELAGENDGGSSAEMPRIAILSDEFDPSRFWAVWPSARMPWPPKSAELGVEQTVALLRSEA
jgi:hypothetical protein